MDSLPPELLQKIAILLPLTSDVFRFARCSRYLRSTLDDPVLFKARLWDQNAPEPAADVSPKLYWCHLEHKHSKLHALLTDPPDELEFITTYELALRHRTNGSTATTSEETKWEDWLFTVGYLMSWVLPWHCTYISGHLTLSPFI